MTPPDLPHLSAPKATADVIAQRKKLVDSYSELLNEFSSPNLSSVGNYSLGKLIGKGSFGKVYLAKHKLTNNSRVVLKSAKKDDPNLAREIHHHRQFNHPHIARLYEVIVTENLVWLVLEYCSGVDLSSYVANNDTFPLRKAERIFGQLVGAVAYVHRQSCVHRDLKLENILMDKHDNVKLADFGFIREYEGKQSYLRTWCGTICYSAPEMIKGEKYAGEKVDVWSLGVILYAILCGRLPFDDENEEKQKNKILTQEPDYPSNVPNSAKELAQSLLSKRPLLRPSLSEVLAHPWLSEYAPQQIAILNLTQPAPFSTELEQLTLERMRNAGVDIRMVKEHVLSQRCDALAGWWNLLIEKEQRKASRREHRRRERESERNTLRFLSAANNLPIERVEPTINEADETSGGNWPKSREDDESVSKSPIECEASSGQGFTPLVICSGQSGLRASVIRASKSESQIIRHPSMKGPTTGGAEKKVEDTKGGGGRMEQWNWRCVFLGIPF